MICNRLQNDNPKSIFSKMEIYIVAYSFNGINAL